MRRAHPPRIDWFPSALIRARATRRALNAPTEPAARADRPLVDQFAPHIPARVVNSRNPASSNLFDATSARRGPMRKTTYTESEHTAAATESPADGLLATSGLPNRLMTAYEVAEFVGCHEETVRRAYLRGLLVSQRFGVRSRRFHPRDVLDWIGRGAPTRIS